MAVKLKPGAGLSQYKGEDKAAIWSKLLLKEYEDKNFKMVSTGGPIVLKYKDKIIGINYGTEIWLTME